MKPPEKSHSFYAVKPSQPQLLNACLADHRHWHSTCNANSSEMKWIREKGPATFHYKVDFCRKLKHQQSVKDEHFMAIGQIGTHVLKQFKIWHKTGAH